MVDKHIKVFNVISHQGSTNSNYLFISTKMAKIPHTLLWEYKMT